MLSLVHLFVGGAALTLIGCAALQDVQERLIANRFAVLILPLAMLHHGTIADSLSQWLSLICGALSVAAAIIFAGFLLWRLGGLGGGDVKLLAASALFVGVDGAITLLVGTVLAGGVLALAYLVGLMLLPTVTTLTANLGSARGAGCRRSIPYGVAIAAGATCAIVPSLPTVFG